MNAATEARDIIAQAAREGVAIRKGNTPDKLKLRGTADAVARWKPIIAQHKPEVLAVLSAANDTDLAGLLAAHGDGSAQGVDWSAWRLTTTTSSPTWAVATARGLTLLCTVEPIPKPRSYPEAWPVERITPWTDAEDDLGEEFQGRAATPEYDAGLSRAEAEREAGASQSELSRKHGASRAAIQKHIEAEGWAQDVEPVLQRKVAEKVAGIVAGCNPEKRADAGRVALVAATLQ